MYQIRTPRKSSARAAFTLIELLVVIAIIAILAAILFPVFAQAREKARQSTCLSNEKQLGLAFMMYVQDYDEKFPMNQYDTSAPGGVGDDNSLRFWTDFVYPYIKNGDRGINGFDGLPITWGSSGVYICPSDPGSQYGITYGANYALMPDGLVSWTTLDTLVPVGSLASIDTPADTVLLVEEGVNDTTCRWGMFYPDEELYTDTVGNPPGSVDGIHYDLGKHVGVYGGSDLNGDCDGSPGDGVGTWGGCGTYPRYRHTGSSNMAFSDGHVKSMARGRLNWYKNLYIASLMPTPH